jgi:GNAT superfamily N-acetyltransferase
VNPNQQPEPTLYYDRLSPDHLARFSGFCCGDEAWHRDLDDFLRDDALHEGSARLSVTYVFYDTGESPVAFTALSTGQIQNQENKKAPQLLGDTHYRSISALLIARLAVDRRHQGKGHGSTILAWIRDMALSLPIGCRFLALHVDRENAAATEFYLKQGFLKPPYVKAHHNLQLMLYDLVGSRQALALENQ